MSRNIITFFKWVLSLGTLAGLLMLYRSVPLVGEGTLDGLTKFNMAAAVMGLICLLVFLIAMRRWKGSERELGNFEKGSNGLLIAMALILLELGIFGMVGVNMDRNGDPNIASMKDCYVAETGVINRIRGIDSILTCTDPSGKETIFAIDKKTADQLGSEKQDLTITYYENTNRIISFS